IEHRAHRDCARIAGWPSARTRFASRNRFHAGTDRLLLPGDARHQRAARGVQRHPGASARWQPRAPAFPAGICAQYLRYDGHVRVANRLPARRSLHHRTNESHRRLLLRRGLQTFMTDTNQPKPRVLSGMRPTGKLHLGHLVGALDNWVRLQDKYDCFYFIADWHALTTDYADTSRVKQNIIEMAYDWLAAGLDPEKSVIFTQSHVPQHAELFLLLSMITPLGWLERVPTYKEQRENIKDKDLGNYGFLGYPVLQAADIVIYRASFVPVGEDQVPHLEITREIARRFNSFYGEVFPEPQPLLTPVPKLPGTDGR